MLRRNIGFNTSCVCAIKGIHMVQSGVEFHLMGQYRSVGRERVKWDEVGNARWIWIDDITFIRSFILKLLIKMHIKARHHLWLQIILQLITHVLLLRHLLGELHIQTAILEDCSSVSSTDDNVLLNTLVSLSLKSNHGVVLLVILKLLMLTVILRCVVMILNMSPIVNLYELVFLSRLLLFSVLVVLGVFHLLLTFLLVFILLPGHLPLVVAIILVRFIIV